MSTPPFEVVVVSYRSAAQVGGLLAGLPDDLPVVVVDNARGADGLEALMAARPHGRYLDTGGGAGYARAANLGARTSRYPFLVMVNPDSRPDLPALQTLVDDVAADPRCASSAALNVGPDGRSEIGAAGWEPTVLRALVHAAGGHKLLPLRGLFARPEAGEPIRVDWTTGACLAVRREQFLALGCFDERFHVYSEDVAFGRTVRTRGLYQKLRTDVTVRHASGGSGAPSLEMMRLRGASLATYVRGTNSPLRARAIAGAVALGYLGRAAQQAARRHDGRAREHLAYARGALTARAWVAGVEVTAHG
jgi:GT2 family glycosyltransferase